MVCFHDTSLTCGVTWKRIYEGNSLTACLWARRHCWAVYSLVAETQDLLPKLESLHNPQHGSKIEMQAAMLQIKKCKSIHRSQVLQLRY